MSEVGSIMRRSIENALGYCSAAIQGVETFLEKPPETRHDIGRAIGSLYKNIYRLDGEVIHMESIVDKVLDEPLKLVKCNRNKVTDQLDLLQDNGAEDSLSYVIWSGKLLPLLRSLRQALSEMEKVRAENSNMKRT